MPSPKRATSPPWSTSGKRVVVIILFVLTLFGFYRFQILWIPLALAAIIAYLIEPVVSQIERRTRLSRNMAIVFIYLLIIVILISVPVGTLTPLVAQAIGFINNTPRYLQQISQFFEDPIVIAEGIRIPVDQLSLDQAFTSLSANLVSLVQTIGGRTFLIFGSVATATISTLGWTILVLMFSFYLVKDHQKFFAFVLRKTPAGYREDVYELALAINKTWHAFLRGQLVLCLVVGTIVFVVAVILGLPNAAILGIVAGIMELIPTFGPVLAAVPAVLIGIVQADASWLGSLMSPIWFALIIAGIYLLIYQFENYYLVPRIIGHHLELHPLVVLVGVVAGATVAGVLGILLAAPVLASSRHILRYIYYKLVDQPPFPDEAMQQPEKPEETAESKPILKHPLEEKLEKS